jgi:hypothetical protein
MTADVAVGIALHLQEEGRGRAFEDGAGRIRIGDHRPRVVEPPEAESLTTNKLLPVTDTPVTFPLPLGY